MKFLKLILKITAIVFLICIVGTLLPIVTDFFSNKKSQRELSEQLSKLPPVTMDFKTPEGAILCLENAYRNQDIEAAVACKDFGVEARLMLNEMNQDYRNDPEILNKTASNLELSFRKFTQESWPDFSGIKSFFTKREDIEEDIVSVTEVCRFPDGGYSTQKLLVAKTPIGWKVLNVVSE